MTRHGPTLFQVTVDGGATVTGLLALVSFFIATALAVIVTYQFLQGYLRARSTPILLLAVGMFLLAPAPMFIRLAAGNLLSVAGPVRVLSTATVKATGLLVILAVVYRGGR